MYYTPTLREHDLGVMYTGSLVGIDIPAGTTQDINARCPGDCTSRFDANLHIFSAMLHAHKAGTQVQTTLLDAEGNWKADLGSEPFYDFNFQSQIALEPPVEMAPGDQINTRCRFNTEGRTETTKFGLASKDEMCLTYLWYYPKPPPAETMNTCM